MARKKKVKEEVDTNENLKSFLKQRKEEHYNFCEEVYYRVSTGSLLLDIHTGGGLMPGLHRFCGMNEGGKTSEAFQIMKNFLKDHRIFMMSCIAALTLGGNWKINDKDSINTSFPKFLNILKNLGANIK